MNPHAVANPLLEATVAINRNHTDRQRIHDILRRTAANIEDMMNQFALEEEPGYAAMSRSKTRSLRVRPVSKRPLSRRVQSKSAKTRL